MRSLKIRYLIRLIALLVVFNFNCGLIKSVLGPNDPNDEEEQCEYPLFPNTGNVGDTIRSCHFEATLNWVKYDPIKYLGPRVILHVTIKLVKAKNGQSASIFTDCFAIQDNKGIWYQTGEAWSENELPQVLISQGQEISGTATIVVDRNASGFTAMFMESETNRPPNITRIYPDQIKWNLGF